MAAPGRIGARQEIEDSKYAALVAEQRRMALPGNGQQRQVIRLAVAAPRMSDISPRSTIAGTRDNALN